MNKIFKKVFLLIIICSIIISFNSYTNSSQNLDDQSYVVGIAIDTGTSSKYKISMQLSTIESSAIETSSSTESSDDSKDTKNSSNYKIETVETTSIDNAINIVNGYLNKNLDLSHCRIVIISEEIAKDGIGAIINTLINKVEIRADCNIIIAQTAYDEFSSNDNINLENVLEKYYDVTSNTETGRGYSELVHLNDFYINLNDTLAQPYATLGIIRNSNKNTSSNNDQINNNINNEAKSFTNTEESIQVEDIGIAVFKNDVLVDTLTANQTLCHEILMNNLNYCTLNIESPFNNDETLDLQLSMLKSPNIKINIINGSPFIEITVYITTKVLSFNNSSHITLSEDKINIIKDSFTKYMENQFYEYLNKTSKELNTDIFGFGRYAAKNFKTINDLNNYNWLDNYKNSTFKVNVISSVKSGHLLTNE